MVIMTPTASELVCVKQRGGRITLWHARHASPHSPANFNMLNAVGACNLVGAGNTADNAIKDYQASFRRMARRHGHTLVKVSRLGGSMSHV